MKFKKICALFTIVAMLGTLIPTTVLAEERGGNTAPLLTKKAEWTNKDTGEAKITLEVKGTPIKMPKKGADVVVVMDYSGSMGQCAETVDWKIQGSFLSGYYWTATCPIHGKIVSTTRKGEKDYCYSEENNRWDSSKSALNTLLGQILSENNGDSKVAFVAFDSTVEKSYKNEFTNKSADIMNKVNSLKHPKIASGKGTNYKAGLASAKTFLDDRKDKSRDAYVVFLSDGEPDQGNEGSREIELLRNMAKVYTIGFGLNQSASSVLKSYASEPEYFKNVTTGSELDDLFSNIGKDIATTGVKINDVVDTEYFSVLGYEQPTAGIVKRTDDNNFEWKLNNFSEAGDKLIINIKLKGEYLNKGESYPTNISAGGEYIGVNGNPIELKVSKNNGSSEKPKLETNKMVKVTFEAGSGSDGKITIRNNVKTIVSGKTVSLPSASDVTVSTGYKLEGWYSDKRCIDKFNENEAIDKDTKIYAKVVGDDTQKYSYTVKYFVDGEEKTEQAETKEVVKHTPEVLVADIEPKMPAGYKVDEAASTPLPHKVEADGAEILVKYVKDDSAWKTVTFVNGANGTLAGQNAEGKVIITDILKGTAFPKDKVPTVSASGRYSFTGWNAVFPEVVDEDLVYTAQYKKRSSGGGSTVDPEEPSTPATNPNSSGGTGAKTDELVTILDEEVPLADGLDSSDHFAYIFGYADNTVKPKNKISREEVSTIFYRLLKDDFRSSIASTTQSFPDVKSTRWSNAPIATLANGKIIGGYPDGKFKPQGSITRAEFAAIVSRFDNLSYSGTDKFSDIKGHWAAGAINAASERGWIGGYPDGTFKPDAYITRAEAMALINKVLNRKLSSDGLLENARYWKDNSKDAWYYFDVMEATNSHNYTKDETTGIEKWTEIKPDKVW